MLTDLCEILFLPWNKKENYVFILLFLHQSKNSKKKSQNCSFIFFCQNCEIWSLESEMFACYKINTTLHCVSYIYTLPRKLSSIIKQIWTRFHFLCFAKHFVRKGWQIWKKKNDKTHTKFQTPCAKTIKIARSLICEVKSCIFFCDRNRLQYVCDADKSKSNYTFFFVIKSSSAIKIYFATHLTTIQILVKKVEYTCDTGMQMFDVFPC